MSCEDLKNWKPIALNRCVPDLPGLRTLRMRRLPGCMTARELLENENREAKELAKSITKHQ